MGENKQIMLSVVRQRVSEWWQKVRPGPFATAPSSEPDVEPQSEVPSKAPGSSLYQHSANRHQPRNVNRMHRREQETRGFNTRVAVWLTKNVGTMQCAYLFACIGIGSLVGVATNNVVLAAIFGSLSSYFLQLVLLPVLAVGQQVLGRHAELQADETFKTSQRSFRDIEEIMAHLSAQDDELLKQTRLLLQLAGQPETEVASIDPGKPATRASSTPRARRGRPTGG